MTRNVNPNAQSGMRVLWGIGAAEYAAPMWAVMFGKARNDGFIAMSRMSIMCRMMVASRAHSTARLLRSCALDKLRITLPSVAASSTILAVI